MVWPDISPSFCRPVIISAALVMFDFCIVPCISYFNIGLESTTTGGSYLLFIYYLYVNCLVFYSLFIYLIIYLFIFAIYLFISCVYSLLSFRWFSFPLSLQPTTTGVILSLYFIVDVQIEQLGS